MNLRCPKCGVDLGVPRSTVRPDEREWCLECKPLSSALSEPDLPAFVPVEVGRDWWDDSPYRTVGRVLPDTANHAWVEVDPSPACQLPPMGPLRVVAQARVGRSEVVAAAADPSGRTRIWLVAGRAEPTRFAAPAPAEEI